MTFFFKSAIPFLVSCTLVVSAGAVHAASMVSYRALYDISLAKSARDSVVTAASGQIAYGVKEACDSWMNNQSMTMFLQLTNGDVLPQETGFSSWESRDGTLYRFTAMGSGSEGETILGGAKLSAAGEGGEAKFTKPTAATFALPSGTVFPMVHTEFILEQARAGKTQFQNLVFEGTGVEGAKLLVTFVSPLSQHARDLIKRFKTDAVNRPGWNFRLAYFDPEGQSSEPLYEIEADYLDNGIPVRWLIDYGEYATEMGMSKLEILPRPDC